MVSIGDDVDRDADSAGRHQLGPRAVNGFDQPPAEFSCVLKVERDQARRRMALVEGVDRFNENRSSIRQEQQLADRFAGREEIGPLIKIDLDLEFRLEFRDDPRAWVKRHDLRVGAGAVGSQIVRSSATGGNPVRPHGCAPESTQLQFDHHKGRLTVAKTDPFR